MAEPTIEQLLAEAKGTLARANKFQKGYQQDLADQEQGRQLAQQDLPSVMDSPATKLARMAKGIPGVLDMAALPAMFTSAAPAAAIWMGARGAQHVAEGGMQRVKEHPFQTAMDVSMAVPPALAGLKAAALASKFLAPAEEAASAGGGANLVNEVVNYARERAGALKAGGMGPKQAMRKASTQAGWPLGQSSAENISHLPQLPSWYGEAPPLNIPRPSRFQALPPQGSSLEHPMLALAGNMVPDEFRGPNTALESLMSALNKLPKTPKRKVG